MSVIININDPDDKDTIEIPLDGIYFNDSSVKGSPDQHVDSPISMVEVSPNGNYLVYYREKDKKIVVRDVNHDLVEKELNKVNGLKVKELNKANKHQELNKVNEVESDTGESYETNEEGEISHLCVSDKKILAYISSDREISKN
jgi:WD40 repeat protein